MAHKRSSYIVAGKKLKSLGFIDYDLRTTLNNGQKAQITKLAGQYSQLLSQPQKFHVVKAPKGTKAALRTAGYTVNRGGKAIIPLYDFDKASIKQGRVELTGKTRSETVYLAGSKQFFQKLKELDGKKLPRNQMVTVQIGDNNTFGSARFRSYWELYKYLSEKFVPKDEGETRERLFARMSVVTITNLPKSGKSARSVDRAAKKARNKIGRH